jgi:hypothetical protein
MRHVPCLGKLGVDTTRAIRAEEIACSVQAGRTAWHFMYLSPWHVPHLLPSSHLMLLLMPTVTGTACAVSRQEVGRLSKGSTFHELRRQIEG